MIGRILAVASNTRKEAFRNKAFVVLVVLGLILMAAGWALAKLAIPAQQHRVVQNFGYFATSIVGVLSAILMGVILLYKELDKKTIFTLIPKPVMRFEIVLGKFVGLAMLLAGLTTFLGVCWYVVLSGHDALEVAGAPIGGNVAMALVLMMLEATLVCAIALFFSSWTRPFLSGMFTFALFLAGRWIFLLQEHLDAKTGSLAEPGPARTFALFWTWVLPDLQTFNVSQELSLGIDIHGGYVMASAGYALAWTAVFLVLGIALFSRRDFV